MTKIDPSLFSAQGRAQEESFGNCPQCSSLLGIRHSKSGPFIGCSSYPACDFSKPLYDSQTTLLTEIAGTTCPHCDNVLAIKKGRYGMFVGCTAYPECHHIEPITNQQSTALTCPECKAGTLLERTNKYGKRFFACDRYPSCRYVVNSQPRAGTCPDCGWELLVTRKGVISCPQPLCGYQKDKE